MTDVDKGFHERRKTGIGGSDAPAVCGYSTFQSSHQIYMAKLGLVEPGIRNPRADAGIRLESAISQWYMDNHQPGKRFDKPDMIRHPINTWMICHLDGAIFNGGPVPVCVVEAKNVGIDKAYLWGEEETDTIPAMYNIQCQHNLFVASGYYGVEFESMDVPVLIGGNDFRLYRVPRDNKLIDALIDIEGKFWNENVLKKVPPIVDGTEGATEMLKRLWPHHKEKTLEATPEINERAKNFLRLRAQDDIVKSEMLFEENKLREAMKDYAFLTTDSGRFTYKRTKDGETVDYKMACVEAGVSAELLARHTTAKEGYRRLTKPRRKQ